MMKRVINFIILVLILPNVIALDLSNYPEPFLSGTIFDAILVVGDQANAEDIVGITDIAMSLQYDSKSEKIIHRVGCGDYTVNELVRIDVGAVQLSSSAISQFKLQNMIVVGGPCANPISAGLLGHPDNCAEGFDYGKARIELYRHKTGKYTLLVAGLLGQDTRAAAQVLANYRDYDFKGMQLSISDTAQSKPNVSPIFT